jgi:salicylate 5-hydroxylase large subunit
MRASRQSSDIELERFFYRNDHWSYVGLEAEIPKPGDFKRTVVGERSVRRASWCATSRRRHHVVENVCAHRGMQFCRERHGNKKEFVCPYHQWSYTLSGDLQGVPFRRGVRQDGKVNGGMPADFRPQADHGLNTAQGRHARRRGVCQRSTTTSNRSKTSSGRSILGYFDRLFDGRKLKILGYNRQRIPGNWKLMQENIKDPYHPGLLHTWFVTFGLWRADNKSELKWMRRHRHAAMISTRGQAGRPRRIRSRRCPASRRAWQLQRPALSRHRARSLVGRPDRGDDDAVPQRHPAAAGQQRVDAPHPARRPRLLRFRVDALRLRRRRH